MDISKLYTDMYKNTPEYKKDLQPAFYKRLVEGVDFSVISGGYDIFGRKTSANVVKFINLNFDMLSLSSTNILYNLKKHNESKTGSPITSSTSVKKRLFGVECDSVEFFEATGYMIKVFYMSNVIKKVNSRDVKVRIFSSHKIEIEATISPNIVISKYYVSIDNCTEKYLTVDMVDEYNKVGLKWDKLGVENESDSVKKAEEKKVLLYDSFRNYRCALDLFGANERSLSTSSGVIEILVLKSVLKNVIIKTNVHNKLIDLGITNYIQNSLILFNAVRFQYLGGFRAKDNTYLSDLFTPIEDTYSADSVNIIREKNDSLLVKRDVKYTGGFPINYQFDYFHYVIIGDPSVGNETGDTTPEQVCKFSGTTGLQNKIAIYNSYKQPGKASNPDVNDVRELYDYIPSYYKNYLEKKYPFNISKRSITSLKSAADPIINGKYTIGSFRYLTFPKNSFSYIIFNNGKVLYPNYISYSDNNIILWYDADVVSGYLYIVSFENYHKENISYPLNFQKVVDEYIATLPVNKNIEDDISNLILVEKTSDGKTTIVNDFILSKEETVDEYSVNTDKLKLTMPENLVIDSGSASTERFEDPDINCGDSVTRGKNLLNNELLRVFSKYTIKTWHTGAYNAVRVPLPNGTYTISTRWKPGYATIFANSSPIAMIMAIGLNGSADSGAVTNLIAHSKSSHNKDYTKVIEVTKNAIFFSINNGRDFEITSFNDEKLNSFFDNVMVQIEKGDVRTDYEPYMDSNLINCDYSAEELPDLPNPTRMYEAINTNVGFTKYESTNRMAVALPWQLENNNDRLTVAINGSLDEEISLKKSGKGVFDYSAMLGTDFIPNDTPADIFVSNTSNLKLVMSENDIEIIDNRIVEIKNKIYPFSKKYMMVFVNDKFVDPDRIVELTNYRFAFKDLYSLLPHDSTGESLNSITDIRMIRIYINWFSDEYWSCFNQSDPIWDLQVNGEPYGVNLVSTYAESELLCGLNLIPSYEPRNYIGQHFNEYEILDKYILHNTNDIPEDKREKYTKDMKKYFSNITDPNTGNIVIDTDRGGNDIRYKIGGEYSLVDEMGYIKDGLAVLYDGILNSEYSHNNNTGIWYDHSGNGNHARLTDGINAWTDNAFDCDGVKYGYLDFYFGSATQDHTVEVCFKYTNNDFTNICPVGPGTIDGIFGFRLDGPGDFAFRICGRKTKSSGSFITENSLTTLSTTSKFAEGETNPNYKVFTGYMDANILFNPVRQYVGNILINHNKVYIGRISKNEYPFTMPIHSIRIYNRALTQEELTHNRDIDMQRFPI